MKRFLSLLTVLILSSVPLRADDLGMVNYHLHGVLRAQRTYCGVLANVRQVEFSAGPRGLIGGLTVGLTNGLLGTRIAERRKTCFEYVVRMDEVYGSEAEVVTVFGHEFIEPGTPVFVTAGGYGEGPLAYYVRVIPASTPEAYMTTGMEEMRLEKRRGR